MEKLKIHNVGQIHDADDGGLVMECLAELNNEVFTVFIDVPDLDYAYKVKAWCDSHIEPYEIDGE